MGAECSVFRQNPTGWLAEGLDFLIDATGDRLRVAINGGDAQNPVTLLLHQIGGFVIEPGFFMGDPVGVFEPGRAPTLVQTPLEDRGGRAEKHGKVRYQHPGVQLPQHIKVDAIDALQSQRRTDVPIRDDQLPCCKRRTDYTIDLHDAVSNNQRRECEAPVPRFAPTNELPKLGVARLPHRTEADAAPFE